MTPPPRNPIAVTTPAAIRDASTLMLSYASTSKKPYLETIIIRLDARATMICVLIPAFFSLLSRSIPIIAPQSTAARSRNTYSASRLNMQLIYTVFRL